MRVYYDRDADVNMIKGKNVAILNDKTTYGKGLADETKKALNKAGFTEKMFESYNKGDKDFTAIVSRMKDVNDGPPQEFRTLFYFDENGEHIEMGD